MFLFYIGTEIKKLSASILSCKAIEGGSLLQEQLPGQFLYTGSAGFTGESFGGKASITFVKSMDKNEKKEKCTINVTAGEGRKKVRETFSWSMEESNPVVTSPSESSMLGSCRLHSRYMKSIGKCELPTASEPGDKCYDEAGKDVTILLPYLHQQNSSDRKLVGFSGGMSIETDPRQSSMVGKGFSVWRSTKDSEKWCLDLTGLLPYQCTSLGLQQEIKNQAGQIIAVLVSSKEKVLYKATKEP